MDDRGPGEPHRDWGRRPGTKRGARGCGGRRAGPGGRRAGAGRRNSPAPPACVPIGRHPTVTSRKRNGKTPTRHVATGAGPAGKRRPGAQEGPGRSRCPLLRRRLLRPAEDRYPWNKSGI